MKSIIITPKNSSEFEFISRLIKKLGVEARTMSVEEKEDLGLGLLMEDADRYSKVRKAAVPL